MSNYAERLNLDLESLELLSDVYEGYARVLMKNENSSDDAYIASCFTIAGVYKAILNQKECKDCFQEASQYFKRDKNDYWIICALCASSYNKERDESYFFEKESFRKLESLYLEKFLNLYREDESENRNSNLTGRLLIPQRIYSDALMEIDSLEMSSLYKNEMSEFRLTNCTRLFNRSAEFIYELQEDSHHWNTIYGNFMPIEPESLAFAIIILNKLKRADMKLRQFLRLIELDSISRLPLELANDLNE